MSRFAAGLVLRSPRQGCSWGSRKQLNYYEGPDHGEWFAYCVSLEVSPQRRTAAEAGESMAATAPKLAQDECAIKKQAKWPLEDSAAMLGRIGL